MFGDPEDAFEDPSEYPATEADIGDASKWSVIKRPIIPSVAFGDGGLDREMVDVIAVGGEGELAVLEDGGDERTPIGGLVGGDQDGRDDDQDASQDGDGREIDDAGDDVFASI